MSRRPTLQEEARERTTRKAVKPFYLGAQLRNFYLFCFGWSMFTHAIISMGLYSFETVGGNTWGHNLDIIVNVLSFCIPAVGVLFTFILVESEQ